MSLPMRYYKNVFVKHDIHDKLKDIRNKMDFRSMSDTVKFLLENINKKKLKR